MLIITMPQFEDLTEDEQENASGNGCGREDASYIRVTYHGRTILLVSDAMEPEDAVFHRDLSWITGIIKMAYDLGVKDATWKNKWW